MGRGDSGHRRALRALRPLAPVLALVSASSPTLLGCSVRPRAELGGTVSGASIGDAELRARAVEFVASHNERAGRLAVLESRAAVELRWNDDDGDHFEACDADLFLARGGRGAIRLSKLGNNMLWIGGDGTQVWVFELERSPSRATIHQGLGNGAATDPGEAVGSGEFTLLSPASLRALAGIEPIGAGWETVPVAEGGGTSVRWPLDPRVRAAVMFDQDAVPTEVVLEDAGGTVLARSALTEPVTARAENLAMGAWPRIASRIEITAPRSGASLRIHLDEPIAMERRSKARFFDLAALLAQLRPEVVEYVAPEGETQESP